MGHKITFDGTFDGVTYSGAVDVSIDTGGYLRCRGFDLNITGAEVTPESRRRLSSNFRNMLQNLRPPELSDLVFLVGMDEKYLGSGYLDDIPSAIYALGDLDEYGRKSTEPRTFRAVPVSPDGRPLVQKGEPMWKNMPNNIEDWAPTAERFPYLTFTLTPDMYYEGHIPDIPLAKRFLWDLPLTEEECKLPPDPLRDLLEKRHDEHCQSVIQRLEALGVSVPLTAYVKPKLPELAAVPA